MHSIVCLCCALLVPVGMALWILRKKNAQICCLWAGVTSALLFALLPCGALVYYFPSGAWKAVLIGAAAGQLGETGRFITMRFILKKHHASRANAFLFGTGYGGIMLVLGSLCIKPQDALCGFLTLGGIYAAHLPLSALTWMQASDGKRHMWLLSALLHAPVGFLSALPAQGGVAAFVKAGALWAEAIAIGVLAVRIWKTQYCTFRIEV